MKNENDVIKNEYLEVRDELDLLKKDKCSLDVDHKKSRSKNDELKTRFKSLEKELKVANQKTSLLESKNEELKIQI